MVLVRLIQGDVMLSQSLLCSVQRYMQRKRTLEDQPCQNVKNGTQSLHHHWFGRVCRKPEILSNFVANVSSHLPTCWRFGTIYWKLWSKTKSTKVSECQEGRYRQDVFLGNTVVCPCTSLHCHREMAENPAMSMAIKSTRPSWCIRSDGCGRIR